MKNNFLNKKLEIDIVWYILGTALPMLTLLVRSPIYTRIYSPELYGIYSVVFISFTYISALNYQWITNNAWRFYLKYKNTKNFEIFWSVTFWLYIFSSVIVIIICLIWWWMAKDLLLKKLIVYGGLYILTNEFINTLLVPARINGKAGYYNILNSTRAILSFLLLLVLTFGGNLQIEAFFIAPIVVNGFYLVFLCYKPFTQVTFQLNHRILAHSRRFIKYGSANLIFNLSLFILISSDRYLIAYFDGYANVGIYNQTYNLAQITIAALFTVFQAALNPILIGRLEKKPHESDNYLYDALYMALYIFLPLTVICSLFSKEITTVLLGKDFREAWNLMPFIFFSAFLVGLNHFAVIKIKFVNNLKYLIFDSLSAAILNVLLNLILIPMYGYKIAALTTIIAYGYLLIILFFHARLNPFRYNGFSGKLFKIIWVIAGLVIMNYAQILLFPINYPIVIAIVKSVIFVVVYFLITRKLIPQRSE